MMHPIYVTPPEILQMIEADYFFPMESGEPIIVDPACGTISFMAAIGNPPYESFAEQS